MERAADDAHLDAALNPTLLEEASQLSKLLQEGGRGEAEEAATTAAVAGLLAAISSAEMDIARRVFARWRAFVAQRNACPLLDLLQALPDLFEQEVLKRLDPTARTMLAQVGRPWLAAVVTAAGGSAGSLGSRRCWLPRLPKGVTVRLRLSEFCTSADRVAWAKANGCHQGGPKLSMSCVLKSKGIATPEQVVAYEAAGGVVQLGEPSWVFSGGERTGSNSRVRDAHITLIIFGCHKLARGCYCALAGARCRLRSYGERQWQRPRGSAWGASGGGGGWEGWGEWVRSSPSCYYAWFRL